MTPVVRQQRCGVGGSPGRVPSSCDGQLRGILSLLGERIECETVSDRHQSRLGSSGNDVSDEKHGVFNALLHDGQPREVKPPGRPMRPVIEFTKQRTRRGLGRAFRAS